LSSGFGLLQKLCMHDRMAFHPSAFLDRPEPLALPEAELSYVPRFDLGLPADDLMQALIAETPWRQETIRLWGKTYPQPRLIAWYGDPGCVYRYSGTCCEPLAWTQRLLALKSRVEEIASSRFNSVLVNFYRDERDSMGFHSDDEKELGPRPIIASLSLGAERELLFKSRRDKRAPTLRVPLASGSLLLMQGDTQANYKHGIDKSRRPLGPRVNLTFRTIVTQDKISSPTGD
jgi:alkylated DNA repair dioxygenase AlkB